MPIDRCLLFLLYLSTVRTLLLQRPTSYLIKEENGYEARQISLFHVFVTALSLVPACAADGVMRRLALTVHKPYWF